MLMNQEFLAFLEFIYVLVNKNRVEVTRDIMIKGFNSNTSILNKNMDAKNMFVIKIIRNKLLWIMLWFWLVQPKMASWIIKIYNIEKPKTMFQESVNGIMSNRINPEKIIRTKFIKVIVLRDVRGVLLVKLITI